MSFGPGFSFGFGSPTAAASSGGSSTWLSQLLSTGRTAAWLTDQASYFSLTGSNVDVWYEANGTTALDLTYVSGTKSIYDTTHPVNTTGKSVRNAGAVSLYACGATGKSSLIWPSGVGSSFYALKIIDAVATGAEGPSTSVARHGDNGSWGGLLGITKDGTDDFKVYHTVYDGSTKTASDDVGIASGWHVIAVRNTGSDLFLKVDDQTEVQAGGAGAMSYLDGVFRILSPYSTHESVAMAAMLHYSAHDTTTRDTVISQLQTLITDLP